MGPVHHVVVVYSDSMSCLQAIEGEDTRIPFICHIMNLPWLLSDRGTRVCFCWIQSAVGSNQVGCSCAWQRSSPCETTMGHPKKFEQWTRAEEVVITRLRIGHTKATKSNSLSRGPPTDCLSPLWSNIEHWPYAPGVCSITGMSWRKLYSWLIECPLWDNSRDFHSGIPTRSGILLSELNGQTIYTIRHLNHPWSDGIC